MRFEDAIDRLPEEPLNPRDKLLAAPEMYEESLALQRLARQHQNPHLDPEEIKERLIVGLLATMSRV